MMNRASESGTSTADHATRYETLRVYALERHARPSRGGLVILLRHGMATWMDAWSRLPAPAQAEPHKSPPIPHDTSIEVVHVLTTMTLSHFPEVYT